MRKVKSFNVLPKPTSRFILLAVLLFVNVLTRAQSVDSTENKAVDTVLTRQVPIANDDLEDPVFYKSEDSIVYDAKQKQLHLYRDAEIKYQDVEIDASYIIYHQDSSELNATPLDWELDSVDKHFLTKGDEKTKFKNMRFNFKSQRAILTKAYSQYGDGFIKSKKIKRNKDKSIYGLHNIYTTCNLENPHFGIAAKKVKIIPNRVAVSGSANLVIEDVPTPVFLPFGLFPLKKEEQRSGFKLPQYDVSQNLGFGLRAGGYYFAINDHVDAMALADIYSLGTWRAGVVSNYNWRYRFKGNVILDYAYNKLGNEFENNPLSGSRNFKIDWSHQLDPNVRPGTNFSAKVTFGSSNFNRLNSYDAASYLTGTYTSNISYSKTWVGKPFNLTVAARHNQNTNTGLVNVTLPDINFSANQIYLFKFRKEIIKPRWYEKIQASYNMNAINEFQFTDTLLDLATISSNDFNNGIKHSIPINATYNMFKYVNANFSVNYNEYWFSKRTFESYNFQDEKIDSVINNGFYTARDFGASANFSTRIYGIKLFKKGRVKGIRHVMTPGVNFEYRPDFGAPGLGYYYDTYVNGNYDIQRQSYFRGSRFGGPPNGKRGGVGFTLGNNLQMKVKSKDSNQADKKVNIIDGLNFRTFYNLAVDSFRWSNLDIGYRTTLFKKISVNGSMSYSPYAIDTNRLARSQEFYRKATGKYLRFERATLAINASLPFDTKRMEQQQKTEDELNTIGDNYSNYVDFNIPYTLNLRYNISWNKRYKRDAESNAFKDTMEFNQNFIFNGDVKLSPRWKVGFNSAYDFNLKKLSFASFNIYRDLHCWEMRLNIIPFGLRKSYNFTLNVKASTLQDLKLVRRKDFRDNF